MWLVWICLQAACRYAWHSALPTLLYLKESTMVLITAVLVLSSLSLSRVQSVTHLLSVCGGT